MQEDNSFSIGGAEIQFEIKLVDIFDLKYYSQNPRINSILERYDGEATQEDIEREMWEKLEYITHELYGDIKKNGGLQDEIIVYDNEVLEGNSRLCAYRHLHKNDVDNPKWNYIRAKVIKSPLDSMQLNTLLCQQHIKGKKDWDPFEKAAYMLRMNEQDGLKLESISKLTSFSKNDVKNHINAYKQMKSDGVINIRKFSYYLEKEKLNQKLGSIRKKDPNIDLKISQWIKDDRIPDAISIRKLPSILEDTKARQKFETQSEDFDTAFDIAKKRNPAIEDTFYRKITDVTQLLKNAKPEQLREEIETNKRKKSKIQYLAKEVKKLCKNVGIDY